jgi:hypothetical protein
MAIDTYDKLQATLADTVNRDDLSADVTTFSPAQIDGMIKRAIAYGTATIQRDILSRGGHKSMETVNNALTTTSGSETVTLPSDFGSVRAFMLTTNPYAVLEFVDPTTLFTQYPSTTTGKPEKYTIIGAGTVYLRPIPDSSTYGIRLVYYAHIPVLSSSQTTNWLLTSHPDIYVAAGMVELCIYLENDDRLQFWKGYYDQKLNDLMGDDRNTRWSAVPTKPNLQVALA